MIGGIIGSVPGLSASFAAAPARLSKFTGGIGRTRGPCGDAGIPFKYTLQKRDADGVFREVPSSTAFAPGEAVIVSIEPLVGGMLIVLENSGQIYSRRVEAGQRYAIPASGAFEIGPDGKDRVLLVQIDQLSIPITIPAKK